MELKQLKETKNALYENLKLVFSSSELISHMKDDIFSKLILKLISLLFEIERELKITKKHSEKMLSEFNALTNVHNIFLSVDIGEYYQVKDEINYLDVYLYNIYQKHLKDFTSNINLDQNKDNISSSNLDTTLISHDSGKSSQPNNSSGKKPNLVDDSTKEKPFTQTFDTKININPQEVQEQVYYQIANQKIMQETKSGIFYIYDSKPKIVPLFKKFFYIAFCINGLIFLLPFLSFLLSAGLQLPPTKNPTTGVVQENILNPDIFSCITYLLFSLFSLFYGAKNLLKKETNENAIYYFNWYFFIFVAIFLAMSLFSLINNFSYIFNSLPEIKALNINSGNLSKLVWFDVYLYSTITSYSFVGFMSIVAIFMSFLNPKKDVNRINEKISQYVNEIKKQQQQQK